MPARKWVLRTVVGYVVIVGAFETMVSYFGMRQAEQGVAPEEGWVVITTHEGADARDTVLGGVDVNGHLYVATNHWPRTWYRRALANPNVELLRAGVRSLARAVPVDGAERVTVSEHYVLPWVVRVLTGFPPREFLRLDPR